MAAMLTIRKAQRFDLKVVFSMWKEFERCINGLAMDNKPLARHLKRRRGAPASLAWWTSRYIGSKRGAVFLAEVDGRPAGYSFIYIIKRNPGNLKLIRLGMSKTFLCESDFEAKESARSS